MCELCRQENNRGSAVLSRGEVGQGVEATGNKEYWQGQGKNFVRCHGSANVAIGLLGNRDCTESTEFCMISEDAERTTVGR